MASGDALLPEEALIYITDTSIAPSSLDTSDAVQAEVTNFSESGGEEDIESRQVFGGGNIDLSKPRTQLEVSFDVIMRYNTDENIQLKWDEYKWGAIASSTVTSAGNPVAKRIYIQFSDGTLYYTRAYNNAKGVSFEPESAADDLLKGTMTFKLSPTQADGSANFKATSQQATALTW